MSMKNIPEPDIDRDFTDVIDPIERKAEDWVLKQLRRFFGVRAIRSYFTIIFFGYLMDNVSISLFSNEKLNFHINNQQEFVIYAGVYISFIIILSLLDFKESRFFGELEQNERFWKNFVQNIQPHIGDADKKLFAMYTFKMGKTKGELRDYFMKMFDQYVKELVEGQAIIKQEVNDMAVILSEFEALRDLAEKAKAQKSK